MHTYNGRNIEDFLNPNDANRTMAKHRVELGSVPIFIYQLPLRNRQKHNENPPKE